VSWYERRLPHWDVIGRPVFVTFRLFGSLPANRVFPPANLSSGRAFVAIDRLLDHAKDGPLFLRQESLANLVVQAIHDGEQRFCRYELHAFVVMANHVHMLVTPAVNARHWLGPLKGFTGHKAKDILPALKTPFWQDESYDHLVRNEAEFERVKRYIEWNPVNAGHISVPEQFPWSSAARKGGGGAEAPPHYCPKEIFK
jgi:REP element-mobilizing transposase RayT